LWGLAFDGSGAEDEEKHDARARGLPAVGLRMIKEAVIHCGWIFEARACRVDNLFPIKNMAALPYLQFLVVTVRNAWFNFRACNKRD